MYLEQILKCDLEMLCSNSVYKWNIFIVSHNDYIKVENVMH